MYSEHGLDALIRPEPGQVCHSLIVVSYCTPGSALAQAASGTELGSLDALRVANDSSYFKDRDALWVKLVSAGDSGTGAPGGGTSLQVSR
jgi:hypothetical protein